MKNTANVFNIFLQQKQTVASEISASASTPYSAQSSVCDISGRSGFNTDCVSSEPLKTLVMLCYVCIPFHLCCYCHSSSAVMKLSFNVKAHDACISPLLPSRLSPL